MADSKKYVPNIETSSRDMQFSYIDSKGKDYDSVSDSKFLHNRRATKPSEGGQSENNGTDK